MSDLYDTDILEWSEHQAALLRRLSAGEAVNAEIDWPNLIEEVEDPRSGRRLASRPLPAAAWEVQNASAGAI